MNKTKGRGFIKFVSAFCAFGFALTSLGLGQSLVNFTIPVSTATTRSTSSTSYATGIAASPNLSIGTDVALVSNAGGWGGTDWRSTSAGTYPTELLSNNTGTGTYTVTMDGVNQGGDYFEFAITAAAGKVITVNGVGVLSFYAGTSGPRNWALISSTSGRFDIDKSGGVNAWANPTYKINAIFQSGVAGGTAYTLSAVNDFNVGLGGAANPERNVIIGSGRTVTFRIVGYGGTASAGTGRMVKQATGPDFSIMGTVADATVQSLLWNGGNGGLWSDTSGDLNWLSGSTPVAFNTGDIATINSTGTVVVSAAGVFAASVTNNISSGTTTLTGGALTTGTLVKSGNGTLVFSNTAGVNNSINAVNLSGGKLILQGGGTNRIGTPSLLLAAGSTMDLGDTDQNVTDFNGSGTVVMTNMGPSAADSNRIVPINDFTATPATPSTFSGQITGTGSFRLGGGILTLEGNNTYTGQTVMNGKNAILYIWGQSNIPAQTAYNPLLDGSPNGEQYATDLRFANTSTLAIKDATGTPNNVVLNRSIGVTNPSVTPTFWGGSDPASSLELAGPIKTLGSVNIANASSNSYGTVILSGANPTITNVTISQFGRLKFNGQTNFGGGTIAIASSTVTPYLALADGSPSMVTITNQLILNTGGRANISVGTYAVTGPIGDGSDNVTNNKVLNWKGAISGPGTLLVTNSGTLVFGAANSYTGGTQLRGDATLLVSAQNQLPAWTVSSTSSQDADLRFSTGGGMFGLDDSAGPTNLVLTNSFWAAGEGTFMAGTNTNGSSMTLAGPISGLTNIVAINSVENAGKLILKGTNTFIGRLQLAQRARVYVVDQLNIPNQIYFSDTTGAGRFGMDASAAESVTLTNEILVGVSATNIIGTFNPGTNATSGGNRALHLSGVISGSGRVRVADGGDLCLDNPANTYTNLTRIGTGRVLFGSDGALGSTNTNSAVPGAYGGIRFETISSSYLVPTNNVILDAGRALLIQNNNTANLDSQGFTLTVAGSVQDEVEGQPGSVNKLGSGEVVLSGTLTYSGNTTVSAGKLTLKQINSSNESSTVSIVAGANLNLDFVGSDTVDKLYLNGVQSAAGTYNSTNSGGAIIGTGSLVVTSSPVIANTAPVITAAQGFSVAENASLGTVVGTVAATDADANASLSAWTIVSGNTGSAFAINSATGQITVAGALNFEGTTSYSLGVTVSDGTATSAEGTVVVAVTNIAEYSDFFGSSSPTADDNGDGISNLMAYALGATSPSSLVVPPTLTTSDATKLTITALIRINDPKLNVVGEYGTTLGTWVTGSPIPGVENSSQAGVVAGVTQRQDFSVSRGTDPKKFLHLKATLQP